MKLWNREKPKKGNYYRKKPAPVMTPRQKLVLAAVFSGVVGLVTLFGFSVVAAYDFAIQSPLFAASRVDVSGNRRLSATEILDQARIAPDANVLSINLDAARARLAAHPWIAWASVSRRLPDRLEISVREHVPMAVLFLGNRKFLMSTEGMAFKLFEEGDPEGLCEVRGLRLTDVSIKGEPMKRTARAAMDFLTLMQAVGFPIAPDAVTGLYVDPDIGLSVTAFDPPVTVYMGWDRYDEKAARLKRVLYELGAEKGLAAKSIDLSKDDRIVVRPVSEAAQIRKKTR